MTKEKISKIDIKKLSLKTIILHKIIIYLIFSPFIRLFYKITIKGRENIPKDRKVICAGNHISYLDPILVCWATNKPVSFMAKTELYTNKFFKWIFPILGSFAVNQHKLEISTIKSAKTVINSDKWLLGIFPQGGIFRNKTLENINRGFIVLAKMFKNDILPISITGVEQYNWKLFQGHIQVKIGKPISYELDEETIIDIWANQICELNGYKYLKKEEKVKICQVKN